MYLNNVVLSVIKLLMVVIFMTDWIGRMEMIGQMGRIGLIRRGAILYP